MALAVTAYEDEACSLPGPEPELVIAGSSAGAVVVLRGDQDVATTAGVAGALARAIALFEGVIVVDLAEVDFVGAETIGVFVRGRELLRRRGGDLVLRSPSRCAMRMLEVSGLVDLVAGPEQT